MNEKEARKILCCNNIAELAFIGLLDLLNDDNDNDLNILKQEAIKVVLLELEKKDLIINEMAEEIASYNHYEALGKLEDKEDVIEHFNQKTEKGE